MNTKAADAVTSKLILTLPLTSELVGGWLIKQNQPSTISDQPMSVFIISLIVMLPLPFQKSRRHRVALARRNVLADFILGDSAGGHF